MTTFKKKQIEPSQRVCISLKQVRLAQDVSIEELSQRTKINKEYIEAIEECRFADLGCASIYQKNFIRKYVQALGVDPAPYVRQFDKEELRFTDIEKTRQEKFHRRHFSNLPQLLRQGLVAAIILSVFVYLGAQIKHTVEPPSLVLVNPEDGFITYDHAITIKGYTEPEVGIYLNGETIVSDEKGNFSETITLNPGINSVIIRAEKKHGKATEETRHIIFKEGKALTAQNPNES